MFTARSVLASACIAFGASCAAFVPSAAVVAAEPASYKTLADTVGPSLVTIKFVMKIEGMGSEGGGQDAEANGVMIESTGLVLVSNAKVGGMASRMGMTANPTDMKVLQGDDTEGLKAKIVARDSELDLAWVQIDDEKAKGKTFPYVDINAGVVPTLGDKVMVVDRMGKFFDHAVVIDEARIGGFAKKPRPLYIPTGLPDRRAFNTLGMPMFSADGKMLGVSILQLPGKEDMEGGGDMGEGNAAIAILPAAEVVKATVRGKEMAAKAPAEPAPTEPAKEDMKKDETKGDEKK
jgi:hypothetical protein